MGLTSQSTGTGALDNFRIEKNGEAVIALAGNPNVGKSTVFNALTGMRQHTGNWPGKTVANAQGRFSYQDQTFLLVDIPGTYSLSANSAEEEVARDFLCFGGIDAAIVVADATCLERNLNFVLQTMEITPNVILCVNLMDEAAKKHIQVDLAALSKELGIPVVGTNAAKKEGLSALAEALYRQLQGASPAKYKVYCGYDIEQAIATVEQVLGETQLNRRWAAKRLLEGDDRCIAAMSDFLQHDLATDAAVQAAVTEALAALEEAGISRSALKERLTAQLVLAAEGIAADCVQFQKTNYNRTDRRLDRILTSKAFGIPAMLLILAFIFWITITGANYPSQLLSDLLLGIEGHLSSCLSALGAPAWVDGLLVQGMYRTLAWVVSVMLPPMAIFFPLFTLLEDLGYLPRVAFNLDNFFKKACSCGKQSLCMAMGFGCNAAGVVGARIIDSPRERLLAILTNNFVPCNGRFPTLIMLITLFFTAGGISSAVMLTGLVVFGVLITLFICRLLSKTVLKGVPSTFILELPSYRKPQVASVIVRSVLDRTLFVLGRSVMVAAPAGLLIWLMANLQVGSMSLLAQVASFLDPFARLLGMDGYILTAFILGFPANEIVFPIILMGYTAAGSLTELGSLTQVHSLLLAHGWTWVTALCVMLFSLLHWPCSTTMLTVHKETQSAKWTAAAFCIPTLTAMLVCFLVNFLSKVIAFFV